MFCVIPELEYINVLVLAKFAVPVKLISSATLILPVPVMVKDAAAPTVSWNTLIASALLIEGIFPATVFTIAISVGDEG